MKILIEVPEEELKIYKRDRQIETLYSSDIKKFILSRYYNDIINAIIIPDNATNGEVVENLFSEEDVELFRLFMTHKWWNAPYKKGENK